MASRALPPSAPETRPFVAPALIVVAGLLLWWVSRAYPATLPPVAPWDFSFFWFYATAFPLWWYAMGMRRTASQARPSGWRNAAFVAGIGCIYAVLQTRFEYLAEHMFFLSRLQHVVMHHLGPFLLALAWPWRTLLRGMPPRVRAGVERRGVRRALHILRRPLLAATLFVGLVAFWLVPAIHLRAMLDPDLYFVMNWSMVADGILFWSLVLDPRGPAEAGISFGMRAALALGVMFPQIAIGAVIALSRTDLYAFYAWCGRIYPSIGPLTDQADGGLIIWIPPAMMSVVSLLLVINMLRLSEERQERASPGDAARTGVSASSWTGR